MEGMLKRAKEKIFKQYEELLPRIAKPTSFYRPDDMAPKSSLDCSVLAFSPPTLSLACPISFSRQSIPVRTEECTHIQTFDLHSAIFSITASDIFKNGNVWKAVIASPSRRGYKAHELELWYENKFRCPVCRRAGALYVDPTVAAALACLPASVSKVAFTESGRFMAVEEHQLKVKKGNEVITVKDSPRMYNTPCYLLPNGSTTTSTATLPYMPAPTSTSSTATPPHVTKRTDTSTLLLPTPTVVPHLSSSAQPAPGAPSLATPGTVKTRLEESRTFSTLRKMRAMGAKRYRRLSTVDLTGDSPDRR